MQKDIMTENKQRIISELVEELRTIQNEIEIRGIEVFETEKHSDTQAREQLFRQKRLYAWCYWAVFQYFLEEYNLSQRGISEKLGKQASTIAQMIHRNTFPSSVFETTVMAFLSGISSDNDFQNELNGLKRANVISTFLVLGECSILDRNTILIQFEDSEHEKDSIVMKSLSRALKDLNEDELSKVYDYVEWLKSRR